MDKPYKPTVVMDFDGVIHSYKSGWQGQEAIPDPAVPGIREAIDEIRNKGYRVVVVSTRCSTDSGIRAVRAYLVENGIVVDDVCKEKPPALCYIDDRAICFRGNAGKLIGQIESFKSWVEDPALQMQDCAKICIGELTQEQREELERELGVGMVTVLEEERSPVDQLRPCRACYYKQGRMVEVTGVFHRWGVNYEEFEDGPGNYTTALVEDDDGLVYECVAGSVQFLDRGESNEERR